MQDFPAVAPALTDIIAGADVSNSNEGISFTLQQLLQLQNPVAYVPITMEVPQGTVAYPDIHNLVTAGTKVSGFVLPDGASASFVNYKVVVPNGLAAIPNASILVIYQTLAAVAGTPTVHMTLSRRFFGDGFDLDLAPIAETPIDENVPTTTETRGSVEFSLSVDPAVENLIMGQIGRDPTNINDDFTGDIQIIAMYLKITRQAG